MAEPSALYRRYRPETFADVIGQEHVTEPLSEALRSGRINHAYLFSGPRGCGKTTSARILARCLNCAEGPTPTPCGACASCTELARGGTGSLDVVEIDAASHGGVDDARELRERATMATARDRYKVYIIDEAHMVSPQGFNALLKLVEEPPEHVMFVFATTEPDKVLQTIRSRTHHYPFHLVPPKALTDYLGVLCEREGVDVGKGVLPLVVRAGGGSVRDSLSVLDQLMAGAGDGGVDYARAAALLGYTDTTLLDDVVGAIEAADGATLFTVVDRVIESGHDPRRFVEDLLERLRDLIVVQALGERAGGVLRALPEDQLARMSLQSATLGAASLSRAADIVNAVLTDMVGASSPRMHLELLCARLLLPAADPGSQGFGTRIDRIERRLGAAPGVDEPVQPSLAAVPAVVVSHPAPGDADAPTTDEAPQDPPPAPDTMDAPALDVPAQALQSSGASADDGADDELFQNSPDPAGGPAASTEPAAATTAASSAAVGAMDTAAVRRAWPGILERVRQDTRVTWMMLSDSAHVHEYSDGVLRLAFSSPGAAKNFAAGRHPDVARRALADELALVARVEAVTIEAVAIDDVVGAGHAAPIDAPPGAGATAATGSGPSAADWTAPADEAEAGDERQARPGDENRSAGGPSWPQPRTVGRPPHAPADADPAPRHQDTAVRSGPGSRSTADNGSDGRGATGGSGRTAEGHSPIDRLSGEVRTAGTVRPPRRAALRGAAAADATGPAGVQAPAVTLPEGGSSGPDQTDGSDVDRRPGATAPAVAPDPQRPDPQRPDPQAPDPQAPDPQAAEPQAPDPHARDPRARGTAARAGAGLSAAGATVAPEDDEPAADDPDAEDSGLVGRPVVEQMLGGRVIDVEDRRR